MYKQAFILILLILCLISCTEHSKDKLFVQLDASKTGVDFSNELEETPIMNIFNYMYFYNGGGVAVGDVSGDGLADLYFTSNQSENKLYLNKGSFVFSDVTKFAGVGGDQGWTTGVTMADVNGDGLLDIYVSQLGQHLSITGKNQLYINLGSDQEGIPSFENQAEKYGLDISSYATQASFFDYDLDGDLDMFQLNHSVHNNGTFGKKNLFVNTYHPTAGDRLFRNDGNRFTDQTKESGIHSNAIGYGLGIAHSDFNYDGYPDIYIANDFHEDDYLYLNNQDGTFTNVQKQSLRHTSRFSMGVDIGDINNDGKMEIVTLDMLPEDPIILKSSAAENLYDLYHYKLNFGYSYQFARNNLQFNIGIDPYTKRPIFSEIALYSGVAATDWSWSVLFADFDHDGLNDLFISNGIMRRPNDLDFINYISHDTIQSRLENLEIQVKDMALITKMPEIKLLNYLYRNNGDLTFTNVSDDWGFEQSSYSHGTAYADLDNDGDLDLVINNTNDQAGIYKNMISDHSVENRNYLRIKLRARGKNTCGIGAKVRLHTQEKSQLKELYLTKGFQSSVEPILHFGLSTEQKVDSLFVYWPDQSISKLKDVVVNQLLEIDQDSIQTFSLKDIDGKSPKRWLRDISDKIEIDYKHTENRFVEFNREALIPHMCSEEGPPIALADFNGDGLEDIFAGNAKRVAANIFFQTKNGNYITNEVNAVCFQEDNVFEDVSSVAIDVDSDGDLDLIVGSGGNEFSGKSEARLQRIYLNEGAGNMKRSTEFPEIYQTNSDVQPIDFDQDGDLDLIFSARAYPRRYGLKPDSYLIENKGNGIFENVTEKKASFLLSFGFVQDMARIDIDGDGIDEVGFAMEWDAVLFAKCENEKLTLLDSEITGLKGTNGWWKTIIPGDFDQDGDLDFIGGNLGLNSKLSASNKFPLKMYYLDYDQNNTKEQILCHYYQGEYRVFNTKDEVVSQLPELKKKFNTNTSFAKASLYDIFEKKSLDKADLFEAYELASCFFENDGTGRFNVHRLPRECQFSTVEDGLFADINGDHKNELILVGNFFPVNIQMGKYDGNYGLVLAFRDGQFELIGQEQTGLSVIGESRDIGITKNAVYGETLIISRNDERLVFYEIQLRSYFD
jgi:hypothetical protein